MMTLKFISKYGKWLNLSITFILAFFLFAAYKDASCLWCIAWHAFLLGVNIVLTILIWILPWYLKQIEAIYK